MKKIVSLLLALAMLFALAACGDTANQPSESQSESPSQSDAQPSESNSEPAEPAEPGAFQPATYEDSVVYDNALADFYTALTAAKESTDLSEMYALMAIADAKLLESATILPYYGDGGNYGVTHVAYQSVPNMMWGSDSDRWETAILTNELIKVEDRVALRDLWHELAGTGTYEQSAKDYLTEKGYTFNDTYIYQGYASDPETWDVQAAWSNTVSEPLCLTIENLAKYDMEQVLQPALAESWECSEDGLTWTIHIRQGVKWVDSQGREVGEVTADDWVASLQHGLDWFGDGPAEVYTPMIEGADAYTKGEITDFSQVGVKALDDYTLEYKLTHPVMSFETMFTYCAFFPPLNRAYYESQGGTFGMDTHDNGDYGTDQNHILYTGPFLVTNWTSKNSIVFGQNPAYWNKDNMNVTTVRFVYNDGTDPLKAYNDCVANENSSAGLAPAPLKKCQEDGLFEEYGNYTSDLNGTTRLAAYNLNRQAYALFNDPTAAQSPQEHGSVDAIDRENGVYTSDIPDDAARTHAAMSNVNFRLALMFGWDRASYHAQVVGEDNKQTALRNSYTPGTFVSLPGEATVSINGTDTTFPAGTYYGEIIQAQLDADGLPAKVWDAEKQSGDGFDGWYNVDVAREYMAKAVEELAAQGVEVSAENPIQIDYVYGSMAETFVNRVNAYEQGINNSLEGLVKINKIPVDTQEELNYSSFWNPTGAENCVDISIGTAWTPDYGDPASYLDTLLPEGDGYMCKYLGLW